MYATKSLVLWLGLVTLACTIGIAASAGCSIKLPSDIPKNSPVYLIADGTRSYKLFRPAGPTTYLADGTQMRLICTGAATNKMAKVQSSSFNLICSNGAFLGTDRRKYTLKDLSCTSIPSSTLETTRKSCASGKGYIYEVTFGQGGPLFSICYNSRSEQTLYTENVINGRTIKNKVVESTRKPFLASGMSHSTAQTNNFYTTNNQVARFQQLFGGSPSYITKSSFLARGHFTPDADMIFGYEQMATYYYVNVNPEFQAVNAGNWVRVENLARSLAAALNDDLHVYNGALGTLKLPNKSKALVAITLDGSGYFNVPEYYFKVIYHSASRSAVVMITLNNPFATKSNVNEFCTNVCRQANLADSHFSDLGKGYTFCCSFNDFKKYAALPSDIVASNLLIKP